MERSVHGRRWSGATGARGCAALLACAGVALALGFVAPSAAGPAPTFGWPTYYATGGGPFSVAIGDLNGDRKPDLAIPNIGSLPANIGTVSVLTNKGNGRLRGKRDYRTGRAPGSVAS